MSNVVIRDKFKHHNYLQCRDKILAVRDHYDDCVHKDRSAPLDVCPCNCYEEQIFVIGMKQQELLFYGKTNKS